MKLLVRCCLSHRNQKERQYFKHALLRNASYHTDFSLQSWACFISSSTSSCLDREGNGSPLQYSRLEKPRDGGAWWAAVHGVTKSRTRLRDFTFTFYFPALEKGLATHSSVLAWRIPGMGEPGGLPSMGSHRVGHDWRDLAVAATMFECLLWRYGSALDCCRGRDSGCRRPGYGISPLRGGRH